MPYPSDVRYIGFVLVFVMVWTAACDDASPSDVPTASTNAIATRADSRGEAPYSQSIEVRNLIPAGWTLDGWDASSDGEYLAVGISGTSHVVDLAQHVAPAISFTSVYRLSPVEPPVEIVRIAEPIDDARSLLTGLLEPDAQGVRRMLFEDETLVTIQASGDVLLEGLRFEEDVRIEERKEGAAASTVITPNQYGTPVGDVLTLPSGVVPSGAEVTAAAWSEDRRLLAVLSRSMLGSTPAALSVYALDEGTPRELWREANHGITINNEASFRDLNGDGSLEVVYRSTSGNFWMSAAELGVSILPDNATKDLRFELPLDRASPREPEDLDQDGVFEWWVSDASWESRSFSHVSSPGSSFVLAWNGEAYVDASAAFGDQIVGEVGGQGSGSLADLVSRFLAHCNAQRFDDARRILEEIAETRVEEEHEGQKESVLQGLTTDTDRPNCH